MVKILLGLIVVLLIAWVVTCAHFVPQAYAYVVETFGKYKETWYAGFHIKTPFIDRIVKTVSLKEQVADFPPQPVITKDNVTMMVDSVVFFHVFDVEKFTYGVERPISAIENLAATTLRNIIGAMTLDETLTGRDQINSQITVILDEATDKYGIKVGRVEVKNIDPPKSIKEAMEKQMKAEREKREAIITAEGKKQAAITLAEGEKQAAILRADAAKEQKIREAQGEAESIRAIQQAKADGIRMINEAMPGERYMQLMSFETARDMANGTATKLIVPSDITNLAGTLSAFKEMAASEKLEQVKTQDAVPETEKEPYIIHSSEE